jgi:tryptophan 7-halogenase
MKRLELYRGTGRIRPKPPELFTDLSWFYLFERLGVQPASYDPLLAGSNFPPMLEILQALHSQVAQALRSAPLHDSHFAASAAAGEPVPSTAQLAGCGR